MKALSYIQNFSRRRALIVSSDERATERLDTSLVRIGVQVEYADIRCDCVDLSAYKLSTDKDVLFLDGDLNTSIQIPRHSHTDIVLIPVIGMVGIEAPSRLNRLHTYGATAFIKKPVHAGTVFFNLSLAVNRHQQILNLSLEIQDHLVRRRLRRYVIKAILLVMEQHKLSDEQAYEWLRKQSMDHQMSLEELAKQLVLAHDERVTVM